MPQQVDLSALAHEVGAVDAVAPATVDLSSVTSPPAGSLSTSRRSRTAWAPPTTRQSIDLVGQRGRDAGRWRGRRRGGLVTAGAMAESTRQESETGLLTPGQALTATASGALTGAVGVIGGRIATSLGIPDVDTLMAAAVKDKAVRTNLSKAIVFGAVQEGFLEELPQSVQEQVAANLAGGKPWSEGWTRRPSWGCSLGP